MLLLLPKQRTKIEEENESKNKTLFLEVKEEVKIDSKSQQQVILKENAKAAQVEAASDITQKIPA